MKPSRQKETLKENINFKRKYFYIEIDINGKEGCYFQKVEILR